MALGSSPQQPWCIAMEGSIGAQEAKLLSIARTAAQHDGHAPTVAAARSPNCRRCSVAAATARRASSPLSRIRASQRRRVCLPRCKEGGEKEKGGGGGKGEY